MKSIAEQCFRNPDETLGRSEDSVHIKVVFMLLWDIGWDPVRQIMLGFEIPKERMGPEQKAAVVPDIVIADENGTCLVGEVKHWYTNLAGQHFEQVRRYQKALAAPYGFLTNGHRWVIFQLQNENPVFDENFSDYSQMINSLKGLIGNDAMPYCELFPYENALETGLSNSKRKYKSQQQTIKGGIKEMSPSWNPERYKNPVVKEFIHELKQLVNEYSPRVYLDEGNTGLMIKDKASGRKLLEYWPEKNKMVNTRNDHKEAGVTQDLSNDYHAAIAKHGNPVQDPKIFIEHLRKTVKALHRI